MNAPARVPVVTLPGGGEMPLIGFGTWMLRGREARSAVHAALDTGYRHLDTATMYGNEADVGAALTESGVDRADAFVTTKIRAADASRARSVLRQSLDALQTDYLDLWLVHWPPPSAAGRRLLWREMLDLQQAGLVRDVGVSNFSLAHIDELIAFTGQAPAVNQIDWGPTLYDAGLLAGHADRGVAVEGYSGLKNTDLGSPVLAAVATAHEVTPAQVVLRWHLEHGITVIPKSVRPDRIAANFDLFGFSLTPAEVAAVDGMAGR